MSDNLNTKEVSNILRRTLGESIDEFIVDDLVSVAFANHVLATFENVMEQNLMKWNARKNKVDEKKRKLKKKDKVSYFLYISYFSPLHMQEIGN